jgi:hypothetical protein
MKDYTIVTFTEGQGMGMIHVRTNDIWMYLKEAGFCNGSRHMRVFEGKHVNLIPYLVRPMKEQQKKGTK